MSYDWTLESVNTSARREKWLARKTSKSQDNLTDMDEEKKEENPISTENESIEVRNVAENPRQLICGVQSIATAREDGVIEQIDGNTESKVTYDLMISAASDHEAFCSIEQNLCRGDDGDKVPFISEFPSKAVKDDDNDENMVFTMEIKIDNDLQFVAKVEKTFCNWDPLYFGKPRGNLVKFEKRN